MILTTSFLTRGARCRTNLTTSVLACGARCRMNLAHTACNKMNLATLVLARRAQYIVAHSSLPLSLLIELVAV